MDAPRIVEHIHGHLGWLAAAALVHPAIVLRTPGRRAHAAVCIAVVLPSAAGGLGGWLYVAYRERLRQGIFVNAPAMGYLFERKEHLAFGAIALAWSAGLAYAVSRRTPTHREALHRYAHRAFMVASLLALTVAILGTIVATYRTF
jgi:hypothetical protein